MHSAFLLLGRLACLRLAILRSVHLQPSVKVTVNLSIIAILYGSSANPCLALLFQFLIIILTCPWKDCHQRAQSRSLAPLLLGCPLCGISVLLPPLSPVPAQERVSTAAASVAEGKLGSWTGCLVFCESFTCGVFCFLFIF